MKGFFLSLVNASTDISSKRFISLTSLILFFVIVIYSVFFSKTVDSNIIYALVSLILGSSVMTLARKNRNTNMDRNENYTENSNNDPVIN